MKKVAIAVVLVFVLMASIPVGCAKTPSNAEEGRLTGPFQVRYSMGEAHWVELSGYTAGHSPGSTAEFEVTLGNDATQTWHSSYSIQLWNGSDASNHEVLATFYQQPINVLSGWHRFRLPITFPDELEVGAYGLAFVIPGRMSAITTIYIGAKPYPTRIARDNY